MRYGITKHYGVNKKTFQKILTFFLHSFKWYFELKCGSYQKQLTFLQGFDLNDSQV